MKFAVRQRKVLSKLLFAVVAATVLSITPAASNAAVAIRDIDAVSGFARESVITLAEESIISGDQNGDFHPERTINRGEMIKIIVNALGIDKADLPEVPTFTDVPVTHWAFQYVEAGYRAGIIKSVTDNSFGITLECTREQMASMFVRALELSEGDMKGKQPYLYTEKMTDKEKISAWAKENVEFALSTGLMNGADGGRFEPGKPAQRQQAAVVTDRFIKNREDVENFAGTFTGKMPYPELYHALEENSRAYKGNMDMSMEMEMWDDVSEDYAIISMLAQGAIDVDSAEGSLKMDMNYDVGISASQDEISQQYRVIMVDGKSYIQIAGSNTWNLADLSESGLDVDSASGNENTEQLISLYRYSTITKESSEYDGMPLTKYTMKLDKEAMKALLSVMTEEQLSLGQTAQIADAEGSIEIYLDNQNRIVYHLFDFTGRTLGKTAEESVNFYLMVDAYYYNDGQDIVIMAPENYETETGTI